MTEAAILEPATPNSASVPSTSPALLVCSRCIYNSETPAIVFDEQGVCNYCKMHDQLDAEYPTGAAGARILENMAAKIREDGKGKPFDVVVGVSGGCDSSYLLYKAKELGLRPLAAHYDNTWNSKVAVENIHNVLKKLDIELYTHVIDNEVSNDIYRAFFRAGVPDIDSATDLGLATTLYMAAEKYNIKYMFEGHSFRTEGVSPIGWCYMDAKYIQSVVKQYGDSYSTHKMRTHPNLWFSKFLKYMLVSRVKKIRPLYWMDYDKEQVKRFLVNELGWQWYGGHHLENRFTAFAHSYFFPRRWGIDQRMNGYSAMTRSGQMERSEALRLMSQPPVLEPEILDTLKKRLGFSDAEFEGLMNLPKRTYRDFKSYKPLFERLRPFFWLMYKMELVPKSFYIKYTSKSDI